LGKAEREKEKIIKWEKVRRRAAIVKNKGGNKTVKRVFFTQRSLWPLVSNDGGSDSGGWGWFGGSLADKRG